jgi:hypothetical protein
MRRIHRQNDLAYIRRKDGLPFYVKNTSEAVRTGLKTSTS